MGAMDAPIVVPGLYVKLTDGTAYAHLLQYLAAERDGSYPVFLYFSGRAGYLYEFDGKRIAYPDEVLLMGLHAKLDDRCLYFAEDSEEAFDG